MMLLVLRFCKNIDTFVSNSKHINNTSSSPGNNFVRERKIKLLPKHYFVHKQVNALQLNYKLVAIRN